MIHIYGDSHASFSFKNLKLPHNNMWCPSITMFRIGRDNTIINFNKNIINENDIIILVYGEVDCRCHIQKQKNLGYDEDIIINNLVINYYKTIQNNLVDLIDKNIKVIIVGIIPPTKQNDYEILHGPILHEFPFLGTDNDRVRYTNKINNLLEEIAKNNNYIYFNGYSYYTRLDGTLKHELSDLNVHLKHNQFFLEEFYNLYTKINKTDN